MLPLYIRNHREVRDEWRKNGKYALAIGAVSPRAYILVLYAMQTAPISHVVPLREVSTVFAACFGARLLKEEQVRAKLRGAGLMVLGVVALLCRLRGRTAVIFVKAGIQTVTLVRRKVKSNHKPTKSALKTVFCKRMIVGCFNDCIEVRTMATVTFSVPDDVNDAFNATFADANKSAVIANLMSEAVERTRRKQASDRAVEAILARRRRAPVYSASELLRSRMRNRP